VARIRKKNKKTNIPEKSKVPSPLADAAPSAPLKISPVIFGAWAAPVLVALALFFIVKNMIPLGVGLVILALVLRALKGYEGRGASHLRGLLDRLGSVKAGFLLCLLWALFCTLLLAHPHFNWILPLAQKFPLQKFDLISLLLWLGMVAVSRFSQEKTAGEDFSSRTARYCLWTFLGIASFLCFYHAGVPAQNYPESYLSNAVQLRYITDSGDFRNLFNLLSGQRDPLNAYFTLLLFHLLPGASTLWVERLSGAFMDLALIGVLYLLGKEVAGRRAGIFTAALAVVSKGLLLKVVGGVDGDSNPLVLVVVLLCLLRLLKKPDLSRFLQWGLASGLGLYSFSIIPSLAFLLVFLVGAWVFFTRDRGQNPGRPFVILAVFTLAFVFVDYLYLSNKLPYGNWIAFTLDCSGFLFPCLVLGIFYILSVYLFPKIGSEPQNIRWMGWLSSTWLFLIISFPILSNHYALAFRNASSLGDWTGITSIRFSTYLGNFKDAFLNLFSAMGPDASASISNDPFLGYWEVAVISLGLAYCFARPDWKKAVLFLALLTGVLPFIFTGNPHDGRLMGGLVPLLVFGGLGLNGLMTGLQQDIKNRTLSALVWLSLAAFGIWGVWGDYSRVYRQWAEVPSTFTLVHGEAAKDLARGIQVYLDPEWTTPSLSLIYENVPVHVWHNSQIIGVGPGGKGPDVVVYLGPNSANLKNQLTLAYPTAQWSEIQGPANSGGAPRLSRCFIPFSDLDVSFAKYSKILSRHSRFSKIPPPPPPFFQIRQLPPSYWERRYYDGHQGLSLGLVQWEDSAVNVNDPAAPAANLEIPVVTYRGVIHLGQTGRYQIKWKAGNRTRMLVDQRKILDVTCSRYIFYGQGDQYMEPEKTGEKSLILTAGDHPVEVITMFQRTRLAPEIAIREEGSKGDGQSLWSTFNF
jgi:hypothetical protein